MADKGIPAWMILDSFRYSLGRMTYQVQETVEWLIENWEEVDDNTKAQIAKELDEELARDSRAREQGTKPFPLGMDCDRAEWVRLYTEINNIGR